MKIYTMQYLKKISLYTIMIIYNFTPVHASNNQPTWQSSRKVNENNRTNWPRRAQEQGSNKLEEGLRQVARDMSHMKSEHTQMKADINEMKTSFHTLNETMQMVLGTVQMSLAIAQSQQAQAMGAPQPGYLQTMSMATQQNEPVKKSLPVSTQITAPVVNSNKSQQLLSLLKPQSTNTNSLTLAELSNSSTTIKARPLWAAEEEDAPEAGGKQAASSSKIAQPTVSAWQKTNSTSIVVPLREVQQQQKGDKAAKEAVKQNTSQVKFTVLPNKHATKPTWRPLPPRKEGVPVVVLKQVTNSSTATQSIVSAWTATNSVSAAMRFKKIQEEEELENKMKEIDREKQREISVTINNIIDLCAKSGISRSLSVPVFHKSLGDSFLEKEDMTITLIFEQLSNHVGAEDATSLMNNTASPATVEKYLMAIDPEECGKYAKYFNKQHNK